MQSQSTQQSYRRRAQDLVARACRECPETAGNPLGIAQWLIDSKAAFSKATFRQYRAALVYEFSLRVQTTIDDGDNLMDAITLLKNSSPPSGRTSKRQTSAQKLKKLPEEDIDRLIRYFQNHPARHGLSALAWLLSGLYTGLRPTEWQQASLNNGQLRVVNAKATSGRAHGETRLIDISGLQASQLSIIGYHLDNVDRIKSTTTSSSGEAFEIFYHHCRTCLYEATRAIWPTRKCHISLYSARHQFAANAKFADLSLAELAALMGHASILTATEHYGRRVSGRGGFTVKAHAEDVERVRQLNLHRDAGSMNPIQPR